MTFAYAAPEPQLREFAVNEEQSDPIARFASAPGEEAVGDLLLQAMSLIGVAYRFGGNSPTSGLDCSGFIKYVFQKSLKVNLPRTSAEMGRVGRALERDELAAGDLVFFDTRGFRNSHVGIYLGGSKFIHSPRTGKNIEVANMGNSYWAKRYNGARRVQRGQSVQMEAAAPAVEKVTRTRQAAVPAVRSSKATVRSKAVAEKRSVKNRSSAKASKASTSKNSVSAKKSTSSKKPVAKKTASSKASGKKTATQKKSS
ncbi:NlpC/P60 family protein [Craterilacuibacter sp.]|uniref:C40 family peptidase n=1 Tax=Craterilacuibacter sp. TaxID=2870909 RepID=UPI003F2CE76D